MRMHFPLFKILKENIFDNVFLIFSQNSPVKAVLKLTSLESNNEMSIDNKAIGI